MMEDEYLVLIDLLTVNHTHREIYIRETGNYNNLSSVGHYFKKHHDVKIYVKWCQDAKARRLVIKYDGEHKEISLHDLTA